MEDRNDRDGVGIFIKNLPKGITVSGISNLCLTAGETIFVKIFQNNSNAHVRFKTRNEAELAIRDLNNKYPYFLKVSFWKPKLSNENNELTETEDNKDRWLYNDCHKCKSLEKDHIVKDVPEDVAPYFHLECDFDHPSLVMRQKVLDFHTSKRCVSKGRGYVNMGDVDRYQYHDDTLVFTQKSTDWTQNSEQTDMKPCLTCGCMTFDGQDDSTQFCSMECEQNLRDCTQSDGTHLCVFDLFAVGKKGSFRVFEGGGRDACTTCCVVLDDERRNCDRLEQISSGTTKNPIRAKTGDMVLTRYDKDRSFRSIVLHDEYSHYIVSLVDYGKVVSVKEVYAMEEDSMDIPWFGGVVLFRENSWIDLETVKFHVKKKMSFDSWLCELSKIETGEVVGEAMLEEHYPPMPLRCTPIESESTVVISHFVSMRTVYVRRVDGEYNDKFVKLNNDVAAYTLEGRRYDGFPKNGDICSARYEKDGCYYRAIVRGVTKRSAIVSFVDYGNDQETKLEDLCYLPPKARRVHCFAIPVCLKGVTNMSSPETVEYFNRLTSEEVTLCLTYDESNPREVILTEKGSGVNVNKMVTELVVPVWKKDPSLLSKSGTELCLENIQEIELETKGEQDIFVLNVNEVEFSSSGYFWATEHRIDYLGHLNGELKRLITGYCSCLENDPYLPRTGELCLVEFEGHWHRAVCLDDRSNLNEVFLLDCGLSLIVKTLQIRKILKEFLEMPALAVRCHVAGFESLNSDQKRMMVKYMKRREKKCLERVKVLKKSNDVYSLEIPFLSEVLEK